ncbi:MAG: hypothetical protein KVP17_001462 [Porospora cf. gigantea B]|uniref:uncharacterized protein n=1 Tax=Porospora cf. gigantea B TaxID=2853592 RepID=UPI0035717AD1|nr:MAG: hypothetical protein KVP17_001462 [Porospora cf. gigantea B]
MTVTSITGVVVVIGSGRFTATLPSGEAYEGAVGSEVVEKLPTASVAVEVADVTPQETSPVADEVQSISNFGPLLLAFAVERSVDLLNSLKDIRAPTLNTRHEQLPIPKEVQATGPTYIYGATETLAVERSVNLLSSFLQTLSTSYETAAKPIEADREADLSTLHIPHGSHILSLPSGSKLVVLTGRYLVVDLDGSVHEFNLDSAAGPVAEYNAAHSTTDTGLTMTVTSITGDVVVVGSGHFTATLQSGEVFHSTIGCVLLEKLLPASRGAAEIASFADEATYDKLPASAIRRPSRVGVESGGAAATRKAATHKVATHDSASTGVGRLESEAMVTFDVAAADIDVNDLLRNGKITVHSRVTLETSSSRVTSQHVTTCSAETSDEAEFRGAASAATAEFRGAASAAIAESSVLPLPAFSPFAKATSDPCETARFGFASADQVDHLELELGADCAFCQRNQKFYMSEISRLQSIEECVHRELESVSQRLDDFIIHSRQESSSSADELIRKISALVQGHQDETLRRIESGTEEIRKSVSALSSWLSAVDNENAIKYADGFYTTKSRPILHFPTDVEVVRLTSAQSTSSVHNHVQNGDVAAAVDLDVKSEKSEL